MPEYGRKKDKARITVCLTCNATGTDKLPLWFIGKAKRPNCFKNEYLDGLKSIGAVWRYNDTAWMNHKIMAEYLAWFDQEMKKQGKHTLLLMDNFSAHEVAVEQLTESLTNTKVKWLPPNATAIHQPLDQGIIQNWKALWQQLWVMFMAKTFDSGKDLSKEMHVLRAIRWGIEAWENGVTPATIQNCWARSQAIDFGSRPLPSPDLWAESQSQLDTIRQSLIQLKDSGYITVVPNIQEYISPYIERVEDDSSSSLVDEIIAQYTTTQEEEDLVEGESIQQPKVTRQEAQVALNTLRQYEEQNHGDIQLLKLLRRREQELFSAQLSSKQQSQLTHWLQKG